MGGLGETMECSATLVAAVAALLVDESDVLLNESTPAQGYSAATMVGEFLDAALVSDGEALQIDAMLSSPGLMNSSLVSSSLLMPCCSGLVGSSFPSPSGAVDYFFDGGEGIVREEGWAPPATKEALRPLPADGLWQLRRPPE
ncbi:hypothetical protein Dimus_003428 [Dionaea muscipula]